MIARSIAVAAALTWLVAGCSPAGSADVADPDAAVDAADGTGSCRDRDTPGATAGCLSPRQSPAHYVEQGLRYFDTLDASADPASVPVYSALVARREWPPWLKLTGYGRDHLVSTAKLLKQVDPR